MKAADVVLKGFHRNDANTEELRQVRKIATDLLLYLQTDEVFAKITVANAPTKPSHGVQACISDFMHSRNFQSEKKGLFAPYKTAGLRPDYYLELSPGRGVILEVERGKTVHSGAKMKIFEKVVDRIEPFFVKENYINVDGVFIFGY